MYSNAFNFSTFLQGSVDLRTGQYGATLPLATLNSLFNRDTSRQIGLAFSMMSAVDTGFGLGWGLTGVSEYSDAEISTNPALTLSTGENYSVYESNNEIIFKGKKCLDVFARRLDYRTICIAYKNGVIETLSRVADGQPLKLTKIQHENGETFDISYQYLGPLVCISAITDAQGTSLLRFVSLNGNAIDKAYLRIADGQELEYDFLNRVNQKLMAISLKSATEARPLITAFDYETDFLAIKAVRNPLGGRERIAYKADGHQVGSLTETSYLPYVLEYERIPGGNQPSTTLYYQYSSDHNFTGFPFNGNDPSDTKDNLQDQDGAYDYWTLETLRGESGNVVRTHQVTHNRFHLARAEEFSENDHRTSKITLYNELPGRNFDAQPANLQIPAEIRITYTKPDGSSRTEVMTQQSDDYGNIITAVDNAGIRTLNEYYPVQGEAGLCPANPIGKFVRYLKKNTVTSTADAITLTKINTYSYQSISTLHNQPFHAGYVVVESASVLDSTATAESSYLSDPRSSLNALIVQSVEKLSRENNTPVTITSYARSLAGGTLTTSVTTTNSSDSASLQTSGTLNNYTQELLSQISENGVLETYAYDGFGRLSQCISAVGSPYEKVASYTYLISADEASRVETRNDWGVKSISVLDGFGREVQQRQQDDDGQFVNGEYTAAERLMMLSRYDNQGREASNVEYDYSNGQIIATREEIYSYDSWGSKCAVKRNDGTTETTLFDPVRMTESTTVRDANGQTLAHTTQTYNLFQSIARTDVYHSDGVSLYSTTTHAYDAFGRPVSVTTPCGDIAYIDEYDLFNRPIAARNFDGTPFSAAYFSATTSDVPTSLSATVHGNAVSLGQQRFDGLGRLTGLTVNGCTTQYQYGAYTVPSAMTNGRGYQMNIGYIPEIGQVSVISGASSGQRIAGFSVSDISTPNLPPGVSLGASNENTASAYTYGKTGKPSTITQTIGTASSITLFNKWTLKGAILDQTVDGRNQIFILDNLGRVTSKTDSGITMKNTWDSFGRAKILTVEQNATIQQQTTIEWDEFNRETLRTVSFPRTGLILNIRSAYDVQNRIQSKTTTVGQKQVIERFDYDSCSRLTAYSVDGGYSADLLPRDAKGRSIIGQTFNYDPLNNLLQSVVRFSDGSTDTITYTYDVQKLMSVQHALDGGGTSTSLTLRYDADGNVTSLAVSDGETIDIAYNALNQRSQRGAITYSYDADGGLCKVGDWMRFYHGSEIVRETNTSSLQSIQHISFTGLAIAQSMPNNAFTIVGADQHGSVMASDQAETVTLYTPQGEGRHGALRKGFNGELMEADGEYALGNGTRFYSPELGVFLSLDSLSPFGVGDINPYRYCGGDPMNNLDPSGHMSIGSIFANIFAVIGAVVGIILAIPTGGASLTITAGAQIMLGAVGLAATVTSIGLEAAGNEQGAKIASGIGGLAGIVSSGVGGVSRIATSGKVKLLGNANGGLTGLEKTRGPSSWGGYGNGNTLGEVPWQGQGTRSAQWHTVKGKKMGFFSRSKQRIYGADQEIVGRQVQTPLAELERRNSVRKGKRNIVIVSGSHGAPDGHNWTSSGDRRAYLIDRKFYNEDMRAYRNARHPMVQVIDRGGNDTTQFNNIIQNKRNHVILGYCYSRNDEALRFYMRQPPVTSYLSVKTHSNLNRRGRLLGGFIT